MDKSLEYIIEVAKTGSISKAAQTLYITPPALSKFIHSKEQELGVALFDRIGKCFMLTQAGKVYVRLGEEILNLQKGMEDELASIARGALGKVSLGFPMVISKTVVSRIIPMFKEKYPDFEVILEENFSLNLIEMVRRNQVDFAIVSGAGFSDCLIGELLSNDQLILAVPAGHPFLNRAIHVEGLHYPWVDLKEFEQENFIGFSPGQLLRKHMDSIFEEYHMEPRIPITVRSIDTAMRCVVGGLGVTITFDALIHENEYEGKIVCLSFERKPTVHRLYLLRNKDHQLSDAMKAMAEICKEWWRCEGKNKGKNDTEEEQL